MFNEHGQISVNLTMEILKGCGFNCTDCAVDKDFVSSDIPEQDVDDLLALLDDFKANQVRLFEFTVGPTDFVSSANGFSSFDQRLVQGLAQRYESMVLSLAMLSDHKLEQLGQSIDQLIPGKKFRLVIPATLPNLQKPKYVDALRRRVGILKGAIKEASFYHIYLNTNMVAENVELVNLDAIRTSGEANLGVRTTLEHGFGHARKGFNNLFNRDQFLRDLKLYCTLSDDLVNTMYHRPLIPIIRDAIELTYRAGKLYYTPVVIEKFHIFDPVFEIPKPWTSAAVLEFKENQYYDNLAEFVNHPECGDCCYVDSCSRGDHHAVMKYLKHDECLTSVKNRYDLNLIDTSGKH